MSRTLEFVGSSPVVYPTLGVGEVPDGGRITVADEVAAALLMRPDLWREVPPEPEPESPMAPAADAAEPVKPARAAAKSATAVEEV